MGFRGYSIFDWLGSCKKGFRLGYCFDHINTKGEQSVSGFDRPAVSPVEEGVNEEIRVKKKTAGLKTLLPNRTFA